jgi:hypothetical protein
VFHLDLEDFLIFSCYHCFQLHKTPRCQAHLLSKQCYGWVRLPLKQFTRINKVGRRCNYISKEKLDNKYMCEGGLWHQLTFMDIHFQTYLWVKCLDIQKTGDKINLTNTQIVKTWTLWRIVKSEYLFIILFQQPLFNQLNTFQAWWNLQETIHWEREKDA